ncbi:MAG: DUF3012 domain-containing protein [Pseudomonadota bacterium]
MKRFAVIVLACFFLNACTPKVGSPEWCKQIEEKDTADMSINEAKDYAKHCIFK